MGNFICVEKTPDGGEIWKEKNGTVVAVQTPEWVKYRDRAQARERKFWKMTEHIKLQTGKSIA